MLLSCHGDPWTGQAAWQPDPDASLSDCFRSEHTIAGGLDETLSGIVNQTLQNGDGLQIYAIAFRPGGRGRFYLPSQRHGTHSETCRSLVWMSAFRAMVLQKSFRGADRKFLEPLVRFMRGDVKDHIGSSKIDHGPP